MADERAHLGIHGRYSSTAYQSDPRSKDFTPATLLSWKYSSSKEFPADDERVVRRFALQAAAREILPREGVAKCMRATYPRADGSYGVDVLYAPVGATAHLGGVQLCKSVWLCPMCAAKISERRRQELTDATRRWLDDSVGEVRRLLLATFTLQHDLRDNLSEVFGGLKRARSKLVSGRAAEAFNAEYGIVGMVRSLEFTYGANGWHPHLHVLMFLDREVQLLPFEATLKERWRHCVQSAGRYASWEHGCDVRFSDKDIAEYVAKWGKEPAWTPAHEIAKSVSKLGRRGGRTPMQLLSDYLDGDERAGRLWLQYAVNAKGERQIVWSRGLRNRLDLEEEKTDEEIAVEQEEIAIILASLSVGAWRVVIANDARGELLQVASTGDAGNVADFLQQLGIPNVKGRV